MVLLAAARDHLEILAILPIQDLVAGALAFAITLVGLLRAIPEEVLRVRGIEFLCYLLQLLILIFALEPPEEPQITPVLVVVAVVADTVNGRQVMKATQTTVLVVAVEAVVEAVLVAVGVLAVLAETQTLLLLTAKLLRPEAVTQLA